MLCISRFLFKQTLASGHLAVGSVLQILLEVDTEAVQYLEGVAGRVAPSTEWSSVGGIDEAGRE